MERILFLVNRMQDKITCGKVGPPHLPEGITALTGWWMLRGQMTLRAILLLIGPSMSDRSDVMIQTKMDTLVLHVGGLGVGLTTPPR